jgi:hypothetical protein
MFYLVLHLLVIGRQIRLYTQSLGIFHCSALWYTKQHRPIVWSIVPTFQGLG